MEQSTVRTASEKPTLNEIVRKNLIEFRRDMKWSRAKVAQEIGIDADRYKDIEKGKTELRLSEIDLVMKGLSFNSADLFGGHPIFSTEKEVVLNWGARKVFPEIKLLIDLSNDMAASNDTGEEDYLVLYAALERAISNIHARHEQTTEKEEQRRAAFTIIRGVNTGQATTERKSPGSIQRPSLRLVKGNMSERTKTVLDSDGKEM